MPSLRLFSTVILFTASILNGTILCAANPPINLVQLAELTPSTRATNDWFGISIAVSGNTVVVGDFDANIETFGAVYVYVKPSTGWANMTQVAKLTSSDNGEGFGTSVAINDNVIVVGAAQHLELRCSKRGPGSRVCIRQARQRLDRRDGNRQAHRFRRTVRRRFRQQRQHQRTYHRRRSILRAG